MKTLSEIKIVLSRIDISINDLTLASLKNNLLTVDDEILSINDDISDLFALILKEKNKDVAFQMFFGLVAQVRKCESYRDGV